MAHINLDDCSVEIPVDWKGDQSIRSKMISTLLGGSIRLGAKGRASVRALDGINLELKPGDRLGILGKNGSGKSSLLRLLAGIYEPSSGTAHRSGTVSTLFDLSLGLDPDASGRENIKLMAIYRQIPLSKLKGSEAEIVEFSGLGPYIDMPVRAYSSGMILRLAFSVSVILKGDVLLMDEWLAVGDAEFSKKAESKLKSLVQNTQIFAIATHNPVLVENICNRVIRLDGGRIVDERLVG